MHFFKNNIAQCLAVYCKHLHSYPTRRIGLCGKTKQHQSKAKRENITTTM